jgi:POT family proton-dependent oligopeptide transporter
MNRSPRPGKNPGALYVLFFAEMWERFAYYLMVGIFLLYLIDPRTRGGRGFNDRAAADIAGSFIALVFLTPFIGGLIADRYLGYIRSIFLGGGLMAAGYIGLALPGETEMIVSLMLIIIGNGFFKPNISTLLGNIYSREDLKPLKDSAFNIFYMGTNIGSFASNFVAAYLRNKYGWGWAFAAAGIGMIVGLIVLAAFLKQVRPGERKNDTRRNDLPFGKICSYVFLPAGLAALAGWYLPPALFGSSLTGTRANDAFIFACLPIIAFYISFWVRARGREKKAMGSLLFIFAVSVAFWTIYNQNATGLTLWAEKHTDRQASGNIQKITGAIFPLQEASDSLRLTPKLNQYLAEEKDGSPIVRYESLVSVVMKGRKADTLKTRYGVTRKGNRVDPASGVILTRGPDPYFANLPKDQWPASGTIKLTNTELFQSINPLFIVLLTLILVPFFGYLRKKRKEPSTATKFGLAMFISGLSALIMVFAILSVPSVYTNKTSPAWLWGTYFTITVSEILLSPIGLSFVSKLSPARFTSLMMGGWFLSTSIGGKMAGIMTGFWNDFTDKKIFFLILVVIGFLGGILIFSRIRFLDQTVREETGSA